MQSAASPALLCGSVLGHMELRPNHSLNPDASPAALSRRSLGAG
jgi:hypothetical protein